MLIEGKIAVVVGGANGIGRTCCESLVGKGAKLCFGDICEPDGMALADSLNAHAGHTIAAFAKCDVTNPEDLKCLFTLAKDTFGGQVEIFFNMAGMLDEFNWRKCIDVNLVGNIHCASIVIDHMGRDRGGKGGVFVAMASISGLRPEAFGPVYCATKHAVVAYVRAWAMDPHYQQHRIRFNTVCPTSVNTNFLTGIHNAYCAEVNIQHLASIALLTPLDVADAFIQAVEDDSWNGKAIRVTKEFGIDFASFSDQPLQ